MIQLYYLYHYFPFFMLDIFCPARNYTKTIIGLKINFLIV
jgi:hypothetical protein